MEIESRAQQATAVQRAHLQSFVDRFRYKASKAKQAQSRLKAGETHFFLPYSVKVHFTLSFCPVSMPVVRP